MNHDFYWYDHLIAIFLLGIVPALSLRSGQVDDDISEHLPPKKHLFFTNGLSLMIGALLVLTAWNISGRSWSLLGFSPILWTHTVMVTTLVLSGLYLLDLMYSLWLPPDRSELSGLFNFIPVTWREYGPYTFLAFSAGIGEEIIFRGFLVRYLDGVFSGWPYSLWIAITLPSLAFAVSHLYQGWLSVLKILLISLLLGWLFILAESLYLNMIVHTAIDLLSGIAGIYTYRKMANPGP